MNYRIIWDTDNLELILTLSVLIVGFLFTHFSPSSKLANKFLNKKNNASNSSEIKIYLQRILGVFFYGIIPIIIISLTNGNYSKYGLNVNNLGFSILLFLILSPILILITFLNRKKNDILEVYPQIRTPEWSIKILITSAVTWLLYLLAYEFMFRGFLLFISIKYIGIFPAIVLNMVLYSLVHAPKGVKEATGSLFLGFVFCIVSIYTENFITAFLLHSTFALSIEWFTLKVHPNIKLIKK